VIVFTQNSVFVSMAREPEVAVDQEVAVQADVSQMYIVM